MVWYREFTLTEITFCLLFVTLYGAYVFRLVHIGRTIESPVSALLIKLVLRTLFFALLLIAYLGPSFGDAKREVKSVGKDIMICVDLSKSMDAFDIQPTRLEKVKFEMKKIVSAFNSDRVGIIIFSSEAFMQAPLTYDQNALSLFIETMNTGLVPASGTDFGPPLTMAIDKLTRQESGSAGETKSKVIILVSDGEDFGEDTRQATARIEKENIKLFTLGVGTSAGGKIYAGNGFKKDREGNTVLSKLNPSELRDIADKTGGQYFEINEERNDVTRLIGAINKIEGELRDTRMVDVSANRYYYLLSLAVILLIIDLLINVKTLKV